MENEQEKITEQSQAAVNQQKGNLTSSTQARSRMMLACIITAFITLLLTAGGLTGAYLLGGARLSNSIEEKRQTVVQEGEVISDVAERVSPSVVSIVTEQQSTVRSFYYGDRTQTSQAAGTGLVIDESGLILTNKHVVPDGTTNVKVVMSDGSRYEEVEVIGRDPLNDLAILKVKNPKNLTVAVLADSDNVRVGQKVIAIGNALGQFQNTVTSGIISGMGRPIEAGNEGGGQTESLSNLFQTDAAINSGNSGGPLLNFSGEVIGINTAVAAGAENIGFSIPINETKGIIESAKNTGKVVRPYIGVRYIMLTPDAAKEFNVNVQKGAFISTEGESVVSGSPAEKAGIKAGDIITKVDAVELNEKISLASAISRFQVGTTVKLTVVRDGKERQISVKLEQAPEQQ